MTPFTISEDKIKNDLKMNNSRTFLQSSRRLSYLHIRNHVSAKTKHKMNV